MSSANSLHLSVASHRLSLKKSMLGSKLRSRMFPEREKSKPTFFMPGMMLVVAAITHPFRDATTEAALPPRQEPPQRCTGHTYGALGETAQLLLQHIVPLYARRLGIPSSVVSRFTFGRITGSVIKSLVTPDVNNCFCISNLWNDARTILLLSILFLGTNNRPLPIERKHERIVYS